MAACGGIATFIKTSRFNITSTLHLVAAKGAFGLDYAINENLAIQARF